MVKCKFAALDSAHGSRPVLLSMTRLVALKTKLVKLSNCQTVKLSNCQTVKLTNCQTAKLKKPDHTTVTVCVPGIKFPGES